MSRPNDHFDIDGCLRDQGSQSIVDAATLSKLHPGLTAMVKLPNVPEVNYAGKITDLGQEFDPVTRLMQVRIEVRNADNRLRPEMLASAEFTTGAGIPAVLVPQGGHSNK